MQVSRIGVIYLEAPFLTDNQRIFNSPRRWASSAKNQESVAPKFSNASPETRKLNDEYALCDYFTHKSATLNQKICTDIKNVLL